MTSRSISLTEVEALFRNRLNLDISSPDDDLIDQGLMDSMLLIELIFNLETYYGITIPIQDLDLDRLRSVRSVTALINDVRGA